MMPISMPEVDADRDFSAILADARKASLVPGDVAGQRYVRLITPGRLVIMLHCPPPDEVHEEMGDFVRAIVPEEGPQVIVAIGYNNVVSREAFSLLTINAMIPFAGFLLGMAHVGHDVVIFEGHPSALAAGCHGADLLIVDEAMADLLQPDWIAVASDIMRRPRILVFLRDGRILEIDPSVPWHKWE